MHFLGLFPSFGCPSEGPRRVAKARRLEDACVLGILKGAVVLVGEPMMVGNGVLKSQSELRGEDPLCLVGEVPRLPGRLGWGEQL